MAKTKKEIDKELMYKKLMPSGLKMIKPAAGEAGTETGASPEAEILSGQLSAPVGGKMPEPRRVAVPALDSRRMVVVNAMEAAVLQKLDSVLERFTCCRCDRCKKDIVALALNKLPPKYVVIAEDQPLPDLSTQTNAQVVTAMIQAVIKVRQYPRH